MDYRTKIALFGSLNRQLKKSASLKREAMSEGYWWDYVPANPVGMILYTADVEHHSEVGGDYDLKRLGKVVKKENEYLELNTGAKIFLDNDLIVAVENMDDSIYIIYQNVEDEEAL